MALGINTESSSGLDLVPIVKYDSRAGRISRVDRTNDGSGWSAEQTDITASFKAVFDLENIECGWMRFSTGGAPDFRMVPLGEDTGPQPSSEHREGFRIMMKLARDCGGDVRELASVAKVALQGMDALHDAYLSGVKDNPGQLPVVTMTDVKPVSTPGPNGTKQTFYAPVFSIVQWVARPADLVFKPKTPNRASAPSVPPTTGATKTPPPAVSEEEFG